MYITIIISVAPYCHCLATAKGIINTSTIKCPIISSMMHQKTLFWMIVVSMPVGCRSTCKCHVIDPL